MGKRPKDMPGQQLLFDRAAKLSESQIQISTSVMQDARVPLARKLRELGWKDRTPRTGNPEHFQLRHPLQPETYLELGDSYAMLGSLALATVSGVSGCVLLQPAGIYPLDVICANKSGLWLNPLTRARTADGLLSWFKPGTGVTLLVTNPEADKPARVGEYCGTKTEAGASYLRLHCDQDDGSIKKLKIKFVAGLRIRVCLVSGSGQILV